MKGGALGPLFRNGSPRFLAPRLEPIDRSRGPWGGQSAQSDAEENGVGASLFS